MLLTLRFCEYKGMCHRFIKDFLDEEKKKKRNVIFSGDRQMNASFIYSFNAMVVE